MQPIELSGSLITYSNFLQRSEGGPYNATFHVSVVDDIREYTIELTYKGLIVKWMFGRHDDIPLLLMAAINAHQVDLQRDTK